MVQLVDGDIRTREVLGWKGVHVLHFMEFVVLAEAPYSESKASSGNRISLILFTGEILHAWFLGINPRGLVPVFVHDGAVHIESNDIVQYLEKMFAAPKLIPGGTRTRLRHCSSTRTISILTSVP